jgi:MFS family permease
MKKTLFYSSLGGVLEFYDFIIFALYAAIISHEYFPTESAVSGMLLTFSVFSIGYLARPVGGIIFGHFGDKYGRKKTFTWSIIIMAMSTLLIAFVPPYSVLGVFAPIILTILRLAQGISIGGEIPGAITFVSEVAPKNRAFACAIVFFGLIFGIILGGLINIVLCSIFNTENMSLYGWRVAFIIGGVFGFFGFYLRKKLSETPLYEEMKALENTKVPFVKVIKEFPLQVVSGWCLCGLVSSGIMALFMLMPAYAKLVGLSSDFGLTMTTSVLFIVLFGVIAFGVIGDMIRKRLLIAIGILLALIFTDMLFNSIINHSFSYVSIILFSIVTFGIFTGVVPSVLADSFPTDVRYTGVGLVYNISFATTGGLAPVIIMSLISATGSLLIPAYYFIGSCILGVFGLIFYPKDYISAQK